MRRAFQGQKRRQRYDHEALVKMAKTMSRRQIMDKTGISEGYLAQILTAKGAKARSRSPQGKTRP
jgi:transcriptional regulator with XRE-family HTH domain